MAVGGRLVGRRFIATVGRQGCVGIRGAGMRCQIEQESVIDNSGNPAAEHTRYTADDVQVRETSSRVYPSSTVGREDPRHPPFATSVSSARISTSPRRPSRASAIRSTKRSFSCSRWLRLAVAQLFPPRGRHHHERRQPFASIPNLADRIEDFFDQIDRHIGQAADSVPLSSSS